MNIVYGFVGQGTMVEPEGQSGDPDRIKLNPGDVYLDVGNQLCERILDHHFGQGRFESATEACVAMYDAFIGRPLEGHQGTVTLKTHYGPDLDGAMAIFYARERLEGRVREDQSDLWARVVAMVSANDQGYNTGNIRESFPILFRTLIEAHRAEYRDDPASFLALRAFPLIQQFLDQDADPERLWQVLRRKPEGRHLWTLVERAEAEYQEDLRKGRIFQVYLPNAASGPMDLARASEGGDHSRDEDLPRPVPDRDTDAWSLVDGIILNNPKSFLFKEFLRADKQRSRLGQGFTLSLVHRPVGGAQQHIISVDPVRGVTLEGLGGLLEAREKEAEREPGRLRRNRLGKHEDRPPSSPGRHHYHVKDPWYDGRGHAFTIIDNPGCGSVLSAEEVNEAFWAYANPGWKVRPQAVRAGFFLQVRYEQPLDRAHGRKVLTGRGWRHAPYSTEGSRHYLPSVARALVPTREQETEDRALHYQRDSMPLEGLRFQEEVSESLVLFPEGIGLLRLEVQIPAADLYTLGNRLHGIREHLATRLRGTERAELAHLLGLGQPFTLTEDGEIQHFFQLQFEEAGFALDELQAGVKGCLYQLARCVRPGFLQLPHGRVLQGLDRVFDVGGLKEAWVLPSGCLSLEVAGQTRPLEETQDLLLALAHFQKEYFVRIATHAADATDRISRGGLARRKGLRDLEALHRDLVEFMSRWRLDEVSSDPWAQAIYQSALQALRIHQLSEAARDRVSQMAELILAEREREQNAFLGFITLFFLPVSLVAGLFSGLQMQKPNVDLIMLPEAAWGRLLTGFPRAATWLAFGFYILVAVAVALALWSSVLIRRKRVKHRKH